MKLENEQILQHQAFKTLSAHAVSVEFKSRIMSMDKPSHGAQWPFNRPNLSEMTARKKATTRNGLFTRSHFAQIWAIKRPLRKSLILAMFDKL